MIAHRLVKEQKLSRTYPEFVAACEEQAVRVDVEEVGSHNAYTYFFSDGSRIEWCGASILALP